MVGRLEEWAMDSVDNVIPSDNSSDLMISKRTGSIEMLVERNELGDFRQQQAARFPSDCVRRLDSLEVPTVVFRKPGCDEASISTVFTKYDNYGLVSPKRFVRRKFETKYAQYLDIDSPVLSLRVRTQRNQLDAEDCLPSIDDLRASPVRASFSHKQPKQTRRQPLFHEGEIKSDVLRRHCVWWNMESHKGLGAWDPTGCVVLESDEFHTRCACKAIGQYAVVAEKVEPKIVDIDNQWLINIKSIFHALSMTLLLLYAVVVFRSEQLWEMFHQLRMTTALLLLFGAFFMCMADLDSVRGDRHHCAAIAGFLQLFYLAAGVLVACEGYACFRALAFGVVGGKLRSYLSIAFGLSLMSLGYALATDIHGYGDDPQCMMGWEKEVKLIFFAPMMLSLLLTIVSVLLIMCNMSTPQLRKESMMGDHDTVCTGYSYFSLYFVATWVAGLFAYVRFDIEGLPSFYPLFQFLNAACGVVFFICQGLLSRRFRMIIARRGLERRRMLVAYNVQENAPESRRASLEATAASQPSSDDSDDSSDSDDSDDSEAAGDAAPRPKSTPRPDAQSATKQKTRPEPAPQADPGHEPGAVAGPGDGGSGESTAPAPS